MKRRTFVTLSAGAAACASLATTASSAIWWRPAIAGRGFVLVTHPSHGATDEFLARLAPYLDQSNPDWRKTLSPMNVANWDAFGVDPADGPLLVRMPEVTGEVEIWSTRWLDYYDREDDDDEVECYPVSGGWWSVDGDWNPSWEEVRNHLFESPNHEEGEFEDWFLDQLKFAELQSLHSDHHREMTRRGRVHWDYVNEECPADDDDDDADDEA